MAEQQTQAVAKLSNKEVGSAVTKRIETLCSSGFTMPKDFNYTNAIQAAMLKLEEVKDMNGKPALDVCTPASVGQALFKMCIQGLDISLNQAYPIVRGNKLCIDPSYFGNTLRVKRIYPDWHPVPRVIRQGDVFEYETDPHTGLQKVLKHETKLENIDNDFVGGYIYLPQPNGERDLYIMTKKQILTAWSKSSSKQQATHKAFDEKMVKKTLVNSGCTMIINSTPSIDNSNMHEDDSEQEVKDIEYTEVHHEVFKEPTDVTDIAEIDAEAVDDSEF